MGKMDFQRILLQAFILHLVLFPCLGLGFGPHKHKINGPIKTIVVLVMENRSFDHMLGWLKSWNDEIDGVTGKESNPLSTTDEDSPLINFSDGSEYVDPDPGHSFQAIREQIFGSEDTSARPAPMNGFAQQAENMSEGMSTHVMRGFRPENLPVYATLATEFALFDKWFASVPTSTQPNRFYVHSATSHGACSNVKKALVKGFPQDTIFDSLEEAGLSFGIYYQNIPATLFFKSLRRLKHVFKFHDYMASFKLHAKLGILPNYVVIEQRYFDVHLLPANDDHPSHDVTEGQKFVKEVYETLRASPQWNEMMFLITYDEHGGFFDHVPTPVTHVPNPDGIIGPEPYYFTFDRLGVRVPTILISPWIEKGTVIHEPNGPTPHSHYEHSSVPATVKKLFNLKADFLTRRDAWAGTFESYFHIRDTPRTDCPETLPDPIKSLPAFMQNQIGTQDAAKQSRLYLYRPFVNAALVNGNFKTIVMLPKFVSVNEWVAINVYDFFTNVNSFYGVLSEFCTPQTCTRMNVGPGRDCLWIDQNRKQLPLPAPTYIDYVMSWVQSLVENEEVFPTKSGRDFLPNFPSQIKLVYRLLLHVFAHIYHAHFQTVLHLKSEGHLNSLFAHFLSFGREFGLLDSKDLKGGVPSSSASGSGPVAIGDLWEKWKELGILE